MEENQNIESVENANEVACQPTPAEVSTPEVEVSVQSEPATQPEVKQVRKNGRNRGGNRNSKKSVSSGSRETCGELENPAEFQEKLSGQNVSGYAEGEGYSEDRPRRERREKRGDRFDRKGDRKQRENRDSEVIDASNEAAEKSAESSIEEASEEHQGPMFESKKFTPRAVEVALSDHRPKRKLDSAVDDGVVSYTPEDNKCSISLFDRIKNIVKSIFGKSEKSKKRFGKKGGKKNWNNNRDGGKRYNNHKGGKGGYNKRRYNDRRPNNNGKRGGNNSKPQD